MNIAQKYINIWGRKKYPNAPAGDFRFEAETREDGYCETCWSSYAVVVVYVGYNEVGTIRDVYISDVIGEILTAALEDK